MNVEFQSDSILGLELPYARENRFIQQSNGRAKMQLLDILICHIFRAGSALSFGE